MNEREFRVLFLMLGIQFTDIDKKYKLPRGTSRLAVSMPHKKGEEALSDVLKKPLNFIFPKRYDENSKRLKPQPTHDYMRPVEENYTRCDLSAFSEENLRKIQLDFFKDNEELFYENYGKVGL